MPAPPKSEKEIFYEALDRPDSAERSAFLEEACAGDLERRRRIEALLAAHAEAGEFLKGEPGPPEEAGPIPKTPIAEGPGSDIGRYHLLQKIGEGGFGVVYMAEQREPVKRRVALKIIKLGMDTKQVVGRFEAERQALAMMDHPNIAKVFDAGATETGRPYFVMELVRGVPITQFCDENHLTNRDRLDLFIQVCGALQHAHQKGIIHRDIKPSNVLITMHDDRPVPKVIDFGIAKATQQELTDITIFTRFHEFIGTPAYMSPEQTQMSGLDIDTRSDIYSLGVLLYELLTGQTPFEARQLLEGGCDEMRRRIREEDPPKPSTRLKTLNEENRTQIAKRRQADPHRLDRLLRGDLDRIVMKALEKNRTRRYETAGALAQDVHRYLHNEPVTAAAPSVLYQFGKFARRHRTALTSVALFAFLLLAATVVSAYFGIQSIRAERRARQEAAVAEAVNLFLNEDLLGQANPEVEPDREIKLKTLLDRAGRQIQYRFQNQPLVEAAIHHTLGKTYMKLQDFPAAEPHMKRAFELHFHELGATHIQTLGSMSDLSMIYLAEKNNQSARDLGETVLNTARRERGNRDPFTIKFMSRMAWINLVLGKEDAAYSLSSEAVQASESVPGVEPAYHALALQVLGRELGRRVSVEAGEQPLREAVALLIRTYGDSHPTTTRAKHVLAAYFFDQRINLDQAESLYLEALERTSQLYGHAHPAPLMARWNLMLLYHLQKRFPEALFQLLKIFEFEGQQVSQGKMDWLKGLFAKATPDKLASAADALNPGWRVRNSPPLSTWTETGFDDNPWETSAAPAGRELWLRQSFSLTDTPASTPFVVIRNAGAFEVFLNGQSVGLPSVARQKPFQILLCDEAARKRLRPGRNVLAVHARDLDPTKPITIDLYKMPEASGRPVENPEKP
jgi:eukaryotic-like serine/threonine-protein kinase